jgi:DnaK suppressor protein
MRKTFLKKARETLQEMRTQLLRNVQDELHEGREQTKDEGMDTYDLASDARDREINFILTDRDREKLQAIDDALARVEDGTYGVCESCEADIAEGRLEALPFTRLCINCQAEREKEAKTMKRSEEDRSYRRLVPGDADDEGSGS